ncbi:MAG: amino acid adenylation domain-containing protein, partial [bacterium]|nr:amino acid adenylation domain-containing protein [bacterium]
KKTIIYDFNNTVEEYPKDKTLHGLFENQVEKTPDKVALLGPQFQISNAETPSAQLINSSITYKELNRRSGQLALYLSSLGVGPDTIIGIIMTRSLEMIIGMMGILKSGGAFLPMDPDTPGERLRFVLEDSGADVVVSAGALAEKVKKMPGITVIDILEYTSNSTYHDQPLNFSTSSNLAYVIYTSGSTGLPKGVLITHSNLSPLLEWSRDFFKFGSHSRVVQNLSYFFDFGVFELVTTLLFGGTLYFPGSEQLYHPPRYVDFLNACQVNTFHTTPSFFNHILQATPGKPMPFLRILHFGGETLTRSLIAGVSARLSDECFIYNGYGPTETTINSAIFSLRSGDVNAIEQLPDSAPIGKPSANNIIYILDRHGHFQPPGIPGE